MPRRPTAAIKTIYSHQFGHLLTHFSHSRITSGAPGNTTWLLDKLTARGVPAPSDTVFLKRPGVGVCLSASLPGNRELSHLCRSPPTPTHAALLSGSLGGGRCAATDMIPKLNASLHCRPTDDKNRHLP